MTEKVSIVEIGEAIQEQLIAHMLAFIKDQRKQARVWTKFKRWMASIRKCKCICGATGVGCECERPAPPPLLPKRLKVSTSGSIAKVDKAHPLERAPSDIVVRETMI